MTLDSEAQQEDGKQPRRSDRRERTARDLVSAAQRVLAARGYHGAKVADIAREAGVGVGTFYLYYPTKEAVFLELVEVAASELKSQMDTTTSSGTDPADISRRRIETFFNFAAEHRDLFRIVFGHDASFNDVLRRAQNLFVADIIENIRRGMAAGIFRDGHPEIWAQAMVGICIQAVAWWVEHDDIPASDIADQISTFALDGMTKNPGAQSDHTE